MENRKRRPAAGARVSRRHRTPPMDGGGRFPPGVGGMEMINKKKVKPKAEKLEKRATPKVLFSPKDPKGPKG